LGPSIRVFGVDEASALVIDALARRVRHRMTELRGIGNPKGACWHMAGFWYRCMSGTITNQRSNNVTPRIRST